MFIAALLTELIVITIYNMDMFSALWLNVIVRGIDGGIEFDHSGDDAFISQENKM